MTILGLVCLLVLCAWTGAATMAAIAWRRHAKGWEEVAAGFREAAQESAERAASCVKIASDMVRLVETNDGTVLKVQETTIRVLDHLQKQKGKDRV